MPRSQSNGIKGADGTSVLTTYDVQSEAEYRAAGTFTQKSVFQLGIFLRVLRAALTVLRPARTPLHSALLELKTKFIFYFFTYNLCFCVFRQLMNCTVLADLCPCFHRSPTKLCPDLVSFACWIVPKFWAMSFAPCPFPNLAGTLIKC